MKISGKLQWEILNFEDLSVSVLYSVLELRQEVFVVEQVCAYRDLDRLDQLASHIICCDGLKSVSYARALPPSDELFESSISRIVVDREVRGLGLGRQTVSKAIDHCFKAWKARVISISAQTYLTDFYESFGFEINGDNYLEDGIPHIAMKLNR